MIEFQKKKKKEYYRSPFFFFLNNMLFPQLKDISWSKYLFYSVLVSMQKQISDVWKLLFPQD